MKNQLQADKNTIFSPVASSIYCCLCPRWRGCGSVVVASLVWTLLATMWSGVVGIFTIFHPDDAPTMVDCCVVDGRFVTNQVQNTSPIHCWRDCRKRICLNPPFCWVNSSSRAKVKVERTDSRKVLPSWHRCSSPPQRCRLNPSNVRLGGCCDELLPGGWWVSMDCCGGIPIAVKWK